MNERKKRDENPQSRFGLQQQTIASPQKNYGERIAMKNEKNTYTQNTQRIN